MMKNKLALFIGVVVAAILLSYMFLFQVRYDQVAVLTTFGGTNTQTPSKSIYKSGKMPYLRWPMPFQRVYKYPTRLQILENRLTQLTTTDNYAVIVATYVSWRIDDDNPLDFFRSYKDVPKAQAFLSNQVSQFQNVISQYRFNELVNTDAQQLKLTDIESQMKQQLALQVTSSGIVIEQFGIRRILIPEDVTTQVFESMRSTRQKLAENIRGGGQAQAQAITSQAESMRDRILAVADGYAKQIKAKGEAEALEFISVFAQEPDLATFLRWLEATEKMFDGSQKATIILDQSTLFSPEQLLAPVRAGNQP